MIHNLKNNRVLVLSVFAGGILLIIMGFFYMQQSSEISALEAERAEVGATLTEAERTILERDAVVNQEKTEATVEATGLNPDIINADRAEVETFFEPAFSWTNGEEYNSVRSSYDDILGDGNSFTDTYLPEDVTIETDDGELMYIDHQGIRTQMGNMIVTPLISEADNRIRYVAIVEYFMHLEAEDLANTDALDASHAVIEFTVSGPEGSRMVSEVDAWTGFTSSVNE